MHKVWLLAVTSLLASVTGNAADSAPDTCATAKDVPPDAVYVPERPEGDEDGRYFPLRGIDADGDGGDDEVVLWRSYSDSHFPGELQEVAYTPSGSGRETYKASFPRIAVLRRGDGYYVQGLSYEAPELSRSGMVQVDVLKLQKEGLVAICTKRVPWVGNY
jgi:hypothetical protein